MITRRAALVGATAAPAIIRSAMAISSRGGLQAAPPLPDPHPPFVYRVREVTVGAPESLGSGLVTEKTALEIFVPEKLQEIAMQHVHEEVLLTVAPPGWVIDGEGMFFTVPGRLAMPAVARAPSLLHRLMRRSALITREGAAPVARRSYPLFAWKNADGAIQLERIATSVFELLSGTDSEDLPHGMQPIEVGYDETGALIEIAPAVLIKPIVSEPEML